MKKRLRMVTADNYLELERMVNKECEKIELDGGQVFNIKVWEDIHGCPTAAIVHTV